MAPPNTMRAALAIPELLELILSHVDMRHLLLSVIRVSKEWNRLITNSPTLQKKLFFAPSAEPTSELGWDPLSDDSGRPVFNPLLVEKFGPCFFDFTDTYGFIRQAESFYALPWAKNVYKTEAAPYDIRYGQDYRLSKPDIDAEGMRHVDRERKRFIRRGASWRRMLVTQPPLPSLGYVRGDDGGLGKPEEVSMIVLDQTPHGGLRMGPLYDMVQHHAGHHDQYALFFRVLWGQPKPPFKTNVLEDHCRDLFALANVVVEMHDNDVGSMSRDPPDPPDVAHFDSLFLCEECQLPDTTGLRTLVADFPDYQSMWNAEVQSSSWENPPLEHVYSTQDLTQMALDRMAGIGIDTEARSS